MYSKTFIYLSDTGTSCHDFTGTTHYIDNFVVTNGGKTRVPCRAGHVT